MICFLVTSLKIKCQIISNSKNANIQKVADLIEYWPLESAQAKKYFIFPFPIEKYLFLQ